MRAVPRLAWALGLSGITPQIIVILIAAFSSSHRPEALLVGAAYAGIIFTFLGGMWWGQTLAMQHPPAWIYLAAVTPSLIVLLMVVLAVLRILQLPVPLMILGTGLILAPGVDRAISSFSAAPDGWLRLRMLLSLALGGLTFGLGVACVKGLVTSAP